MARIRFQESTPIAVPVFFLRNQAAAQALFLFSRPDPLGLFVRSQEWKQEPPDRAADKDYCCRCRGDRFSLGVAISYDVPDDELDGLRTAKRVEAYDSFTAFATCLQCQRIHRIVAYETG